MHFIWNGLLSKVVVLQEAHGTKDLRFFGISIGWLGFGVLVGVERQPTPLAPDACPVCELQGYPNGTAGCGNDACPSRAGKAYRSADTRHKWQMKE